MSGQLRAAPPDRADNTSATSMYRPISVVIPTRNRPAGLQRALNSVYAQTLKPLEIIVVDDCSEVEPTEEIFAACPSDIRCVLIRNYTTKGAQVSRNSGLRRSTADFVALLDDDDEFVPEKLSVLAAAVSADTDVIYHSARMVFDDEGFSYISTPAGNVQFEELLIRNVVGGTSMVCVRRERFLAIGGFNERMPALQDYEAWLRCAKAGLKFKRVDGALTEYHHTTSAGSISKSLAKVDQALALIQQFYERDYAQLDACKRTEWERRLVQTRTQRMLMNDARWEAAIYCLRSSIRLRSFKVMAMSASALMGMKAALKLKNAFGL